MASHLPVTVSLRLPGANYRVELNWLYVPIVIDVFSRRAVARRVSRSMTMDFVKDALE